MNSSQIIAKKRDDKELSPSEISFFVDGYARGDIPDYQTAALAMAIYLNGMTPTETAALTEVMWHSGVTLAWPDGLNVVDKHSTGGVGDKVSLVLAPLLACCGLKVPMISGRGLGPTGGTLDKLESIPGFRTDLSLDEVRQITNEVGCVITGATDDIAPADKKLYALRDVTATVASIPLITASIMSKKLAEGLNALMLDVKWGSGAFMKTLDQARELANSLVETGNRIGVKTTALITDMNQPIGRMCGNAVEVNESIAALRGDGPDDLTEITLALGSELLVATGQAKDFDEGTEILRTHIDSGRGYEKFCEMVIAQGGDIDIERTVGSTSHITALQAGFISSIDTEQLGLAVIELGGGRKVKTDAIDHRAGLEMHVRIGDKVERGQTLTTIFGDEDQNSSARAMVARAIHITPEQPSLPPLIVEKISDEQAS